MTEEGSLLPSRPSLTNCADRDSVGSEPSDGGSDSEERSIPVAIQAIVEELESEHAQLAKRALSAVPEHRLRKEATREVRGGGGSYKSRAVKGVLRAFLRWVSEQLDMQIVFKSPEGEEVGAPLPNSYKESYIAEKYGVIKDAERAFVRDAPEPHTAMVTLSGSNLNSRGGPRCPGDHLVDLKESWDRFVRRELQRQMDRLGFERYDAEEPPERWWEYAVVVEPHKSGYAHMHVAVFTSHAVEAVDFESVVGKHVEKCSMAGSEAHEVLPGDDSGSAVSVNAVDPEASPEEGEDISNLGSYIAEYIGAAGEELWDRPVSELVCFSLLWATETRRVHFSQGFHELSSEGMEMRNGSERSAGEEWELYGVRDGEDGEVHEVHGSVVCEGCSLTYSGIPAESCPDCGCRLKSRTSDYMRPIRGISGGDTPIERD
jgi:hypothetical protein